MGSWKPGIKNCELGKEGSNLVSATERMCIISERLSNLFRIEFVDIKKDYVLRIFHFKSLESETLLVLLAEAKLVVLSATLSLKLHNQFGLKSLWKNVYK